MPRKSSKKTRFTLGGIAVIITFIGAVLALLNDTFDLLDRFKPEPTPVASSDPIAVSPFTDIFPMFVGNEWHYTYGVKRISADGSSAIIEETGEYSEKVSIVTTGLGDRVKIIEIELSGQAINPYCASLDLTPGPGKTWFVTDGANVYVTCDQKQVSDLAMKIRAQADKGTPFPELSAPTYALPLNAGKIWPWDASMPPRDDTAYQWYVDAQIDVAVPAGNFTNCYRILLYTNSDEIIRTLCPGVGLVSAEYHHRGMPADYRIELASFNFVSKP